MSDTEVPSKVVNAAFFDKISSDPRGEMFKTAADGVTEFTRVRMREDGFLRKILPPTQVTNSDLDRMVHTDKPVIIVDKEPGSPAAVSLPFAAMPTNRYIRGAGTRSCSSVLRRRSSPRTWTSFARTTWTSGRSCRTTRSRTCWRKRTASSCPRATRPWAAPRTTTPETGVAQWNSNAGAITRSNLADSRKVMPSTFTHLEAATALINNISIKEIEKWQRDQIGGDLAEDILVNGFSERTFANLKWIVTIKTDLVKNGTIYFFADPKFLGKHLMLEDTTMYIDRRAFMLEFFAYQSSGAAIGNVGGVTRTDFASTFTAGNN
jgi:hypothetical protein